ncbi:MAG: DUF6178 family protein [Myxococcota bacterium]
MTEPSHPARPEDLSGIHLLRLARRDRAAARARLRALSPEAQARACQELRPEVRSEFLMLLDHPEKVVPLLPDAEVCFTVRAGGMSEAAWLLEMASPEQLRACFDLDCWNRYELDRGRLQEWIGALIEAGRPALVRAIAETDLELWLLALRSMTEITIVGKEDIPPVGAFTLDGVVYLRPHEGAESAWVREIFGATFERAQALYWRLTYGMIYESPSECEEYALRWRGVRLNDLGFPDREQAMALYRPLRAKQVEPWEPPVPPHAMVASFTLPERMQGTLLGRALLELPPARAADVLGYVLGVANALAIADDLPLSDVDTIPRALDKALRGIDAGLQELSRVQGRPAHEVLDHTRPTDLFRIGATLHGGDVD